MSRAFSFYISVIKESTLEKQLKEEEKILESISERKGTVSLATVEKVN